MEMQFFLSNFENIHEKGIINKNDTDSNWFKKFVKKIFDAYSKYIHTNITFLFIKS